MADRLAPYAQVAWGGPAHHLTTGAWREIPSLAIWSRCRAYRYALVRVWNPAAPVWLYAMLNPSKASESAGDPTVDRQVTRAQRHGAGAAIIVNAAALCETDRRTMLRHPDPIGAGNAIWIARFAPLAATIVLAHGPDARKFGGDRLLACALAGRECHALAVTKDGSPGHPLYVGMDVPLRRYDQGE